MIPTERLLLHTIFEVELLGKHPSLTEALAHLLKAKDALSGYADEKDHATQTHGTS